MRGNCHRVLLVTHDASRTGAPHVAVLVARALVNTGHQVLVMSRRTGPVLADFEELAPTLLEPLLRVRRRLWLVSSLRWVAWSVDTLAATATLLRHPTDVVYLNSTAAAIYLRPARWLRRRVVLHVHESQQVASAFLAEARVMDLSGVELVACSPSTHADLGAMTGRDGAQIHLIPSVPDADRVLPHVDTTITRATGKEPVVVGACGSVGRRKGTDLWTEMADLVIRSHPELQVRFVWLGDLGDPELAKPGRGVQFLGPSRNPYPQMARFDIATLPSRDDPFPLVVLEAMLLGTPVVAFDVGGVREQIGDTGILVPPGDVQGFAAAVVTLLHDEVLRARLGSAATRRAQQLYSTEAFCQKIARLVDQEVCTDKGDGVALTTPRLSRASQ